MSRHDDLDDYKLDTTFETSPNRVIHKFYKVDRARGFRKTEVLETWVQGKVLGGGTFGTVRLEKRLSSQARVDAQRSARAVKQLHKWQMERLKMDFRKELLALTKFSREKFRQYEVFVKFWGWYENEESVFLAMEYFPRGTLGLYIPDSISQDGIRSIATQILEGLRIMHAEGFTHRDLKPENIFVVEESPDWWIKIGDFGISKRVSSDNTIMQTATGTPLYLAPEVHGHISGEDEESSAYTNAVDIWSFGCVIYEIIALRVPFPSYPRDLIKFCAGGPFPEEPLAQRTTKDGIGFLKLALEPHPTVRASAETMLKNEWLHRVEYLEESIDRVGHAARAINALARVIPKPKDNEMYEISRDMSSTSLSPRRSSKLRNIPTAEQAGDDVQSRQSKSVQLSTDAIRHLEVAETHHNQSILSPSLTMAEVVPGPVLTASTPEAPSGSGLPDPVLNVLKHRMVRRLTEEEVIAEREARRRTRSIVTATDGDTPSKEARGKKRSSRSHHDLDSLLPSLPPDGDTPSKEARGKKRSSRSHHDLDSQLAPLPLNTSQISPRMTPIMAKVNDLDITYGSREWPAIVTDQRPDLSAIVERREGSRVDKKKSRKLPLPESRKPSARVAFAPLTSEGAELRAENQVPATEHHVNLPKTSISSTYLNTSDTDWYDDSLGSSSDGELGGNNAPTSVATSSSAKPISSKDEIRKGANELWYNGHKITPISSKDEIRKGPGELWYNGHKITPISSKDETRKGAKTLLDNGLKIKLKREQAQAPKRREVKQKEKTIENPPQPSAAKAHLRGITVGESAFSTPQIPKSQSDTSSAYDTESYYDDSYDDEQVEARGHRSKSSDGLNRTRHKVMNFFKRKKDQAKDPPKSAYF